MKVKGNNEKQKGRWKGKDEPRISATRRNESPRELPCTASMRTNGLKPATINHYLHGVGYNSFFLTGLTNDNKWKLITCCKKRKSRGPLEGKKWDSARRYGNISEVKSQNNEDTTKYRPKNIRYSCTQGQTLQVNGIKSCTNIYHRETLSLNMQIGLYLCKVCQFAYISKTAADITRFKIIRQWMIHTQKLWEYKQESNWKV